MEAPDFRLDRFGGALAPVGRVCPLCNGTGGPTMAPAGTRRVVVRTETGEVHEHYARMTFGGGGGRPDQPADIAPRDFAVLARGGLARGGPVPPLDIGDDDPLITRPATRAEAITAIAFATVVTLSGGVALALISAGWLP